MCSVNLIHVTCGAIIILISVMDYDRIINKIGGFGKYQKVFLIVVSLSSALNAMTSFVLNFVFGEHAHRYVGFVLKKIQDLSSILDNLI